MAAGGVRVNQALSGGAIEQLNRALPVGWRRRRATGLLQSRAELGALGAISDSGCARLPKVLGGRCNSGQGMNSNEAKNGDGCEPRSIGSEGSDVKQPQWITPCPRFDYVGALP